MSATNAGLQTNSQVSQCIPMEVAMLALLLALPLALGVVTLNKDLNYVYLFKEKLFHYDLLPQIVGSPSG